MSDKNTKHSEVSRLLSNEILAGKHPVGKRLPSEVQLAAKFKVSRPTIGRALEDLQDQGLIERRPGSGTYVAEPGDGGVKPRLQTASRQIGIMVPNLRHTEIFETICGELTNLALVRDYRLCWGDHGVNRAIDEPAMTLEEAEELCAKFIRIGVSGVFVVPFEHQADRDEANLRLLKRLRQAGIPIVLIDRDAVGFPRRSEYDVVGVDNYSGGYRLADHLIKLGAKRLVYVTKPHTASTVDMRIAGAQSAMLAHGIDIPKDFVRVGDPADAKFVRNITQSGRIEAVLCTSDHIAAQLLQTFNKLKVRVPEDIRLVGFDDVRFANLLTIPLTTMHQPCRDIAQTAFNCMMERMANPSLPGRSVMLAPRMIVRETCGAYRK